jgi:hypothetical protein
LFLQIAFIIAMLSAVLTPLSFSAPMAPVVQTLRSSSSLRMAVESMCVGTMAAGATKSTSMHTKGRPRCSASAGTKCWVAQLADGPAFVAAASAAMLMQLRRRKTGQPSHWCCAGQASRGTGAAPA